MRLAESWMTRSGEPRGNRLRLAAFLLVSISAAICLKADDGLPTASQASPRGQSQGLSLSQEAPAGRQVRDHRIVEHPERLAHQFKFRGERVADSDGVERFLETRDAAGPHRLSQRPAQGQRARKRRARARV